MVQFYFRSLRLEKLTLQKKRILELHKYKVFVELENPVGLDFRGCPSDTLRRAASDGTHVKQLGGRKAGGWCSHVWLHASHPSLAVSREGFVTGKARAHPASLKSHNGKSIPRMRALIHSPSLDVLRLRAKHWHGRVKPPPWWIPFLKLFLLNLSWDLWHAFFRYVESAYCVCIVDVQRSHSMFQLSYVLWLQMIEYFWMIYPLQKKKTEDWVLVTFFCF